MSFCCDEILTEKLQRKKVGTEKPLYEFRLKDALGVNLIACKGELMPEGTTISIQFLHL